MAQATSTISTITSAPLVGIWLHSVADPEGTSSNFLYGNIGRTETIGIQGTPLRFVGRSHPVYDVGGFESQTLDLEVLVPYGPTEQEQVEWFRQVVRGRQTIGYRDSRGRLHYVIITEIAFADEAVGTRVSFKATTVDYTEEV